MVASSVAVTTQVNADWFPPRSARITGSDVLTTVALSLVFRLVREWYVRDGLEDDLAVGVDRGWEGLGRAVDRDGRGAQGA